MTHEEGDRVPDDPQYDDISVDGSVPDPAAGSAFRAARDFLLDHRDDYEMAYRDFRWPKLDTFNWAVDWFDGVLATERPDQTALWVVEEDGSEARRTFAEMSATARQIAAWLRSVGVRRYDRILLMLGNQVELWEVMLAAIRIGAVVIPASTLLGPDDLADRIERGNVDHVVARSVDAAKFADIGGAWTRVAVGAPVAGWLRYDQAYDFLGDEAIEGRSRADDPMLLYFTSGTTAQPKLVAHTHTSYPVGHLSTMYWQGLRPGDVHLNISSPGWAKHAWSNLFAPWNAGATVLVVNQARFNAPALLDAIVRCGATTFCAPPTVWRMLIQADLGAWTVPLRECVAAGEPLNPEVIEQVRAAWGVTVRDGYGQTETTAQIGNPPGQPLKPGSMGRPLPGYRIVLADVLTGERVPDGVEGEICLDLDERPVSLMKGYLDDEHTAHVMRDGLYHTGDVAVREADGYITYVGRTDDVFKASDYRISPFEVESALIEHEAVVEAAVVPSPDPLRLAVVKAYVMLADGYEPGPEMAREILRFARGRLAPYQRVRRIEFAELPKTISGKIRRVELRGAENSRTRRAEHEYWEDDFPELRNM
ncbi:AMP-binding protein [Planosporangium thailandense]|uniref:AMP-binding protein n=1 Tax=Planosporangium thailandense TaxID=765197 RepID=A0ABX0XWK3_9ACTN|nr:AMP-binding protein [Planosporangium thailandense]NJC69639.1 AMP-binding protein [Planosporangium thailandense]